MSRGYNARKKAKRQQARYEREPTRRWAGTASRRLRLTLPALAIVFVLAATAILGQTASQGGSRAEIERKVSALLDGIPQNGNTLGSASAPVTLQVFADLECPTVRLFAENYLPSVVDTWVRPGHVKLAYRSLQTDTVDERTFFQQEVAALAAGKQGKMWNFALTFVQQQQPVHTGYVTDEFLAAIAEQVVGLDPKQWRSNLSAPLSIKTVALGVRTAHERNLRSTPSFLISYDSGAAGSFPVDPAATRRAFLAAFKEDVEALNAEATKDAPTVEPFNVPN